MNTPLCQNSEKPNVRGGSHALEQPVTFKQSISARTAAAQAEQRGTEAETRVLGRGHSTAGEIKELTTGDNSSSRSWATMVQLIPDSSKC